MVDLEVGTWDESQNCVLVSDGGEGTFASQTHYAAVRKSAQEILWNFCNGNGIKNGYSNIAPCVLEFDMYATQSLPIVFDGVDYQTVTLAEGNELPAGFIMENGIITSDGTVGEGEWTINIAMVGVDGYLALNAPIIIRMVEPIHVSETQLKVGEAANIIIDAPYYPYNGFVGNYYLPFLYEYTVSDEDAAKLANYGLTIEKVMSVHHAWQNIDYDVNTAMKISGTPTKAGEVEVTVTLQIPLVYAWSARWPNYNGMMSPVVTKISRTFTLLIAE